MKRRTKHLILFAAFTYGIAFLIGLIVFLVATSHVQAATIPHAAVCRVVNQVGNVNSIGSGTLVARDETTGVVITCWHIFRDEGVGKVKVEFRKSCYWGNVIGKNPTWDLAAILIARPDVAPAPLATVWPRGGDTVHWAGYGPVGKYISKTGRVTQYLRAGTMAANELLELTGHARQGDSGGPVFNDRGELVAVLAVTDGQTISGIYGGRVSDFLQKCCPGGTCPTPRPRWGASPPVAAAPRIPQAPKPTRPMVPIEPPAVTIKPPASKPPPAASGDLVALRKEIAVLRAAIAQLKDKKPPLILFPSPDYDKITAEVLKRLPPITFRTMAPKGTKPTKRDSSVEYVPIDTSTVHLGETQDFYLVPQRKKAQ